LLAAREGDGRVSRREVRLTPMSRVPAHSVRWLWEPFLPLGKVTVLAGSPGLGKSMLTALLAALVSTGRTDGALRGVPADVLLASAEDDPHDTIKPRLLAVGADLDRVHLLDLRERLPSGEAVATLVRLPHDVPEIAAKVRETGARLVVLDPVVAYLAAERSAYSEQDVREALAPLKAMAEETGCAVLVVMHLNKGEGADPLRRIGNSGAFTALARSVLLLGSDPEEHVEDGARRVLSVVKGNVGWQAAHALAVERVVVAGADEEEVETAAMRLLGASHVRAEDLLEAPEDRSALGAAMAWLRDLLADGPLPARTVLDAAKRDGHAQKTVNRAKGRIGARSHKHGGQGGAWMWELPPGSEPEVGDVDHLPVVPERPGGHVAEDGHADRLYDAKTPKAANTASLRARDPSPCPYERHRPSDWRLADGGPRVCGICHPPAAGIDAKPATGEA
jgi:putative DNA primase/helicase